jgi:hypothetical protein
MFCHKCGKPQTELPEVEIPPPPPPIASTLDVPVEAPPPPEIGFSNKLAVKTGLLAAAVSSMLTSLPIPPVMSLLWMPVCLVGAGFFAVYVYKRRTGEEMETKSGAKLGWVTGIFCFGISVLLFTVSMVVISSKGGLAAFYREQVGAQAAPGMDLEEVSALLESPAGMASILIFSLVMMFAFFTLLPTLGGAMGAKVLEKD